MDKYEFRVKLEQIQKLKEKKEYESAASIAETMDWKKSRSVSELCGISDIFDKIGEYEKSREILLLAYDRSPLGRMIVYRLAENAINSGNFQEAKDFYDDFVEVAPRDAMKYVLKYKIAKGTGKSLSELIVILERLRDIEYTDEWAYELANLYHKAGMVEACVKECDDIFLWFGDGDFVQRAMGLKVLYAPLTPEQMQKFENKQSVENLYEMNKKADHILHEKATPGVRSFAEERFYTMNLQSELAKEMSQIMKATETGAVSNSISHIMKLVDDSKIPELQKTQEIWKKREAEESNVYLAATKNIAKAIIDERGQSGEGDIHLDIDFKGILSEENDGQISLYVPEEMVVEKQITGQMSIEDILSEWEKTKQAAEVAIAEAEQKRLEDVKSKALQQAGDILDCLTDYIPQLELEEEVTNSQMEEAGSEDDSILVLANKLGETSKEMFPEEEFSEEQEMELQEEPETELLEEEPEMELLEEEPETELLEEEPETELLEEPEMELLEEEPEMELLEEEPETELLEEEPEMELLEEEPEMEISEEEQLEEEEVFADTNQLVVEKIADEAMKLPTDELPDELISEVKDADIQVESKQEDLDNSFEATKESEDLDDKSDEKDVEVEQNNLIKLSSKSIFYKKEEEEADFKEKSKKKGKKLRKMSIFGREKSRVKRKNELEKQLELTKEQRKIFTYFSHVREMEEQICNVLYNVHVYDAKDKTSSAGNIIISGESGMGKTKLATDLVKVIQKDKNENTGKVGKIKASALNEKDVNDVVEKMLGGYLIIDQAGELNAQTIENLDEAMSKDTDNLLLILEDGDEPLMKMLEINEKFASKFTEKIQIPILNNDELVAFGSAYANELAYTLDEMATLALYDRIGKIEKLDMATTLIEVKDIVDQAIVKMEKGGIKKMVDIILSRRYSEDDYIILREKDFEK